MIAQQLMVLFGDWDTSCVEDMFNRCCSRPGFCGSVSPGKKAEQLGLFMSGPELSAYVARPCQAG